MIAIVYVSLLIFALAVPAITAFGWQMLGILALLILAYLTFAEWDFSQKVREYP